MSDLKTIYRVEGLLQHVGGEFTDSPEVYHFERQEDAKHSFRISWEKITPVDFEPLQTRAGLAAYGTIEGTSRLLGRILPLEQAQLVLSNPTHF